MEQSIIELENSGNGSQSTSFLHEYEENSAQTTPKRDTQQSLSMTTLETNIKEDKEQEELKTSTTEQIPSKSKKKLKIPRKKKQAIDALTTYCEQNGILSKEKAKFDGRKMKQNYEDAFLAGQINDEQCAEVCGNAMCVIF